MTPLLEADLPNLFYRGKVRDTFSLDDYLLMVSTDRISAFDVVLPAAIPDKGRVLNLLSAFWFDKTAAIIPNHMMAVVENTAQLAPYGDFPDYLCHRSMMVRRAERIDVECVVRGYLSGSAWAEYAKSGTVHGQPLLTGLRESEPLPQPLFTPTTKADTGHDLPISLGALASLVGAELARELEEKAITVYRFADDYARSRGIIIADTKMEFGFIEGRLSLIDELLTPDSSRFWDAAAYAPGQPQPSFDKQYLRDWLTASGWNKEPPAPSIPDDVLERTAEKYREAYRRLVGQELP